MVPFFREAYLIGQPAPPKDLDSCRRERVSFFSMGNGVRIRAKSLCKDEWSKQKQLKRYRGPGFTAVLFMLSGLYAVRAALLVLLALRHDGGAEAAAEVFG
jgi:hypothetical protein